MKLEFAREVGRDAMVSAFWWRCVWWDCWQADYGDPIPDNDYDWLYWCQGIPQEDLDADPLLKAEYEAAYQRYINRPTARCRRRLAC